MTVGRHPGMRLVGACRMTPRWRQIPVGALACAARDTAVHDVFVGEALDFPCEMNNGLKLQIATGARMLG